MGRLNVASANVTPSDLRAWCNEANAKPLFRRMCRWYFVKQVDGVDRIDCLEGSDGDNVRREIEGTLQDFVGWPQARMAGYRKWLRQCALAGSFGEA